jgi:hypothetical protein
MIVSPPMTGYALRTLVQESLKRLILDFEPLWLDTKLLNVAVEDLEAYLRYVWANSIDFLKWTWLKEISEEEAFRYHFLSWFNSETLTGRKEIDVWLGLWYQKWKERIKLVFHPDDVPKMPRTLEFIEKGSKLLTPEEINSYKEFVKFGLIKRGELVGTDILSEMLVKREAGKLKTKPVEVEDKLKFVSVLLRETRIMTTFTGPLINIEVKGGLFHRT